MGNVSNTSSLLFRWLYCLPYLMICARAAFVTAANNEHVPYQQANDDDDTEDAYYLDNNSLWQTPPVCSLSPSSSETFCVFTDESFANGRGISVLARPEQAAALRDLPAFSEPDIHKDLGINQIVDAPFYAQKLEGRGIGLIANRTIHRGEWLMSISPAFIMDRRAEEAMSWADRAYFQRLAFERLPEAVRTVAYDLYGQEEAEALDSLDDILMTNTFGYQVALNTDDEDDSIVDFRMLFPEIARFNHACRPAADCFFDPATLAQHIYAARNVFAGEEITINYIPPLQVRDARQQALNTSWGFSCGCDLCAADPETTKTSDTRVEKILKIQAALSDRSPKSTGSTRLAHELIQLLREERLWTLASSGYAFAAFEHNGIGDKPNAQRYAQLALEHSHLCNGADHNDEDRDDLLQIIDDPEWHFSWKFRVHAVNHVTMM